MTTKTTNKSRLMRTRDEGEERGQGKRTMRDDDEVEVEDDD